MRPIGPLWVTREYLRDTMDQFVSGRFRTWRILDVDYRLVVRHRIQPHTFMAWPLVTLDQWPKHRRWLRMRDTAEREGILV